MSLLSGAYFEVDLSGSGVSLGGSFLSVSGLDMEFEYEVYCEGGSSYPRYFFKNAKPQTLVLEQGTVTDADSVSELIYMVNLGISVPLEGTILLRDSFGNTMRVWHICDAHLVKYAGPSLNSNQPELAVSRIELMYNGSS
ncbi:MAG: phage tail protein [Clostridiales bacterium]|nr:phage tail protein [Clostridiales bacterium]